MKAYLVGRKKTEESYSLWDTIFESELADLIAVVCGDEISKKLKEIAVN